MKLNQPLTADFDPNRNVLKITGVNNLGKASKVEFDVPDENSFLSWLVAALHEKHRTPDGGGRALTADKIGFAIHPGHDGQNLLAFKFTCGEMELSFVAGIHAKAPESLLAIQGHLEQALVEMGHSRPVVKQ